MAFLQKTSYKWIGLNNPDEIINDVDGFNIFKHFKSSVNAPDIDIDTAGFIHFAVEKINDIEIMVTTLWDSIDDVITWTSDNNVPTWDDGVTPWSLEGFESKSDNSIESDIWAVTRISSEEV